MPVYLCRLELYLMTAGNELMKLDLLYQYRFVDCYFLLFYNFIFFFQFTDFMEINKRSLLTSISQGSTINFSPFPGNNKLIFPTFTCT